MILVVDDDKNIRLSLKLILERNEYEVTLAEGPKEAMQIVRNTPAVELVLMDMNYTRATDGEDLFYLWYFYRKTIRPYDTLIGGMELVRELDLTEASSILSSSLSH